MLLEEILSQLETYNGTFPRLALESAIEQQSAITPKLLEIVGECKNNLDDLLEDSTYFLHLYAPYLLAQFREKAAYPLIIEFFSIPGDITLDVTGDLVTDDLSRIIASVFDGNLEPLKQLIENQQANKYVRSAGLKTLVTLVVQEIIPREQLIQYFAELFSRESKTKPDFIKTKLVINSCKLGAVELKPQIDEAFELNLIDDLFIDQESVDDTFQKGTEAALIKLRQNRQFTLITDIITEMKSWACFRNDKLKQNNNVFSSPSGFTNSFKPGKAEANKKKKIQKESRRKNRNKKNSTNVLVYPSISHL